MSGVKINQKTKLPRPPQHQLEMQELSEDLTRVEKAAGDDSKASQISPALLHQDVVALQSQLHSLQLQKNVGGKLINLSDPSGNIEHKLVSQIEQIKASAQKAGKVSGESCCNFSSILFVLPPLSH